MSPKPQFIAYYRVSTAKQGHSGLGLEAQRSAVAACVSRFGGEVLADYQDIESGKVDDRPALVRAMEHCQLSGARLVIAKLDRLSRDVTFIAQLLKSGLVSFIAADMPDAGEMQTQLIAVFSQHERQLISQRTKAALAAAKARGTVLGTPANLRNQQQGSLRGNAVKAAKADAHAAKIAAWVEGARASGVVSLRAIAAHLNATGIKAPRGGQWSPAQVSRVLARASAAA